ncbi:MAG: hypothetical protein AB1403_08290 [Candidatus Riflebacteria bacterium]
MKLSQGLSMVEIMVAVVIIGLAVGPLIGVLSSSNKMSNASIFEETAVHYSRELADQLLSLSPNFSDIVADAQALTGDTSINLGSILNDTGFQTILETHGTTTTAIPLQINGNELPLRLLVSPLEKAFTRRRIKATVLDTSANTTLKTDKFWKVQIELSWVDRNSGRNEPRHVNMSIVIKEG